MTQDRLTEHPDVINVLARMNVYQEVVLAALYRTLPIKVIRFIYLLMRLEKSFLFLYHIFEEKKKGKHFIHTFYSSILHVHVYRPP